MIMDIYQESLKKHKEWKGKIEVVSRVSVSTKEELMLAYTPGVAEPCREINKDINNSYIYTRRHNTIFVITDGTAILGLGDIGPEAGMPVMEGKAALFKAFGDVDAVPLCLKTLLPSLRLHAERPKRARKARLQNGLGGRSARIHQVA